MADPAILTTVVGSYPVPDWLVAAPSEQALIDATRVVIDTQENAGVDVVCDGELYRFDINHPETNGMIEYFVRPMGGVRSTLTFDEVHAELYPNWAPDGSKVAFVAAGKGESQVMVLDVNLFSSVKITNMSGADSTRPSFSPDGSRIAFLSNKGMSSVQEFSLWVTDARPGSTARKIGDKVKLPSKGAPSWTPDGKGVIAVVDDPDQSDPIAIFPVDGQRQAPLSPVDGKPARRLTRTQVEALLRDAQGS